mgnify:CR=1 FL=1
MRWLVMAVWVGVARGEPKLDFARGILEEARGGDGTEWFEKALAGDPGAWPLARHAAEGRRAAGDIEAASTIYREFAGAHPGRLEAQLGYADFLREVSPRDDFAAKLATEALEGALTRWPDHLAIIRRLFRCYEQRGMRDRSMALFEQVSGRPGAALATAEMARTLFESDDPSARGTVDEAFRAAVESTPADPVLARAASEHFRTTGRLSEAIAVLERHVAASPSSLELRTRLGVLLFAADREDEGVAVLEEVLAIDARQALAHQALAKLHRKREQPERARPHAAAVLQIRGGDADEFVKLAEEFLAAGLPREARLLLEKGLFDHPEDAAIAVQLAIATRRDPESRGRAPRAFREAESLSGTEGPATRPEFLREFAECLVEAGETAAAEERLRAAIRAYPEEARAETAAALRRLAGLWLEEGRNESAARQLLRRAEALEP